MRNSLLFLLFLLASLTASTQNKLDTIYLKSYGKAGTKEHHRFTRIVELDSTTIKFKDFYKKGQLANTGAALRNDSNFILIKKGLRLYNLGIEFGLFEWFSKEGLYIKKEIFQPFHSKHDYTEHLDSCISFLEDSLKKESIYVLNYRKNGQLKNEGLYLSKERLHGKWRTYYEGTGSLKNTSEYFYGELTGESRFFYRSGVLQSSTPYKKGKKNGVAKFYDIEERLIQIRTYKEDLLIKSENYFGLNE